MFSCQVFEPSSDEEDSPPKSPKPVPSAPAPAPPQKRKSTTNPVKSSKSSKTPSNAVVSFSNGVCREWVYEFVYQSGEIIDDIKELLEGETFYVGRSRDFYRRGREHSRDQKKKARLLNQVLKTLNAKVKDMIQIIPELPHGVPADRAREMEAFFIESRKTIYAPSTTRGARMCNLKVGDASTSKDDLKEYLSIDRYREIEDELKRGFPHPFQWKKERELAHAEAVVDVVDTVLDVEDGEEIDAERRSSLEVERELANKCRAVLLREKEEYNDATMALYNEADRLVKSYAAMPGYTIVPRDELVANLNSLGDHAAADDDLKQQVRFWQRFTHPDKHQQPITTVAAQSWVTQVREHVGATLEDSVNKTTTIARKCIELRDWCMKTGKGRKPAKDARKRALQHGETLQDLHVEGALGAWISDWRSKAGKPEERTIRILLRHFPNLIVSFFKSSKRETTRTNLCELARLLQEGYGWWNEPLFEGFKPLSSRMPHPNAYVLYNMMCDFLRGKHWNDFDILLVISGKMTEDRASALRQRHSSNRPVLLQSLKKGSRARDDRVRDRLAKESANN